MWKLLLLLVYCLLMISSRLSVRLTLMLPNIFIHQDLELEITERKLAEFRLQQVNETLEESYG